MPITRKVFHAVHSISRNRNIGAALRNMTEKYFQRTIEKNKDILEKMGRKGDEGVWIFGYGSLLWKVNFEFTEKRVGYIYGYARRLWQKSRDHRGTAEKPGRVATLIPVDDKKQIVWGVVYYIPPHYLDDAMETLNFREKDGYTLQTVKCYEKDTSKEFDVVLYLGEVDSKDVVPIEDLAWQVAYSVGPSGANSEYLFKMADALRKQRMGTIDDEKHMFILAQKVRAILNNNNNNKNNNKNNK